MKINISPGVIIFVLGFIGLVFCLVEGKGEIGSKIPLTLFFTFIMGLGIFVEAKLKDGSYDEFGEMESPRGFG